ncbi:uncharacterized protein LOC111434311 isoform X1 [Cucurbita moschata]|uniref:Uncharacterized protein LOC111434311 isoform X1 n=1 Tax=Cucurbita moschata TaxID=3662 RepID=A0A6J1EP53_CUCMO|nr:uncharacterized protein LOC111434311 isoform X1 [Cucurbita moschata]XP_022927506.1 uncharacterized protein LOC111434311 isoform X1 [Cucurbita moschata]XP_022927507.1 uncharacterized protein LOC111434311 isoform X1 [Cucurbita moschata]
MVANMKNTAHGIVPEYGAIFMSNSMTRTECFERKLFGLPSWLGNFVLQIKSGMILFLFEYENRVLHGVFQAVSDGAINIVPHAYSSSGQQFPSQVKFSVLWCCNPLSEDQFQNAIKENYFSTKKFNFGLSKVQVHRLLSLFSLTKFSDRLCPRQLSSDSFERSSDHLLDGSRSVADCNGLMLNGSLQEKLIEGEDRVNTMQESATLSHYNIRNGIPSLDNSIHCAHTDTRNLACNSGFLSYAQITMPSRYSQSYCMTSMPFQSSVNLEDITDPVTQSQINLSCSVPSLLSLPTREFENDGGLRRSILTSEYPSYGLKDTLFPYQNEQGLARQEVMEAYYEHVPKTKEFPSQLPFDSVEVSRMPSIVYTAVNHGHECHGSSGGMHSDCERKSSVFSRLAYPSDASIQEFSDYDHEKVEMDPSNDEVRSILQRHHWQRKKTNHEVRSPERNVGRKFVKKKWTKSSVSSHGSNCFQVSDKHGTKNEDSIDCNTNPIAGSFVDFKRRRKQCKVEDSVPTGGENVNVGSVQLSGVQQKRRKLIRPNFAGNELRDSGATNNVSPSLDSPFQGKASIDHMIEMVKTEKLCPELPDIIWLVDDEDKNIGCETVATDELNYGSNRNGSEDWIASANYTSKDLGVNENCRLTHNSSTSEDHTTFQNLNNSGLCSRQEQSSEGSELNAGNSFIRFNEVSNKSNAKELIESSKMVKPYQDYFAVTESSSPLNSASESAPKEVIERRNQHNENEKRLHPKLNFDDPGCFF